MAGLLSACFVVGPAHACRHEVLLSAAEFEQETVGTKPGCPAPGHGISGCSGRYCLVAPHRSPYCAYPWTVHRL